MNIINYAVEILNLSWEIFIRPWQHESTLWMILPLIIILLLIQIYFGRHSSEELGWNSAFSNTVSLLWVCVLIFRFLFDKHGWETILSDTEVYKGFLLASILSIWVFILLLANFFHFLPKKFAFVISSADSVYILAYISISLIVNGYDIDRNIMVASGVLFVMLFVALQIIRKLVPMATGAKIGTALKERKGKRKKAGKKAARTRKLEDMQKWIKRRWRKIKSYFKE